MYTSILARSSIKLVFSNLLAILWAFVQIPGFDDLMISARQQIERVLTNHTMVVRPDPGPPVGPIRALVIK